jgi:hypothetical protein
MIKTDFPANFAISVGAVGKSSAAANLMHVRQTSRPCRHEPISTNTDTFLTQSRPRRGSAHYDRSEWLDF